MTVLVRRGDREFSLVTTGLGPSVLTEEWTGNPNPYVVPSLTDVTGASAGLGLAVAYLESLTGVDVLGGETAAVTGTLWPVPGGGARVGEVSGLADKVEASLVSGYEVLVVPIGQFEEAVDVAGDRPVTILGVRTLSAAMAGLCALGDSCAALPLLLRSVEPGDLLVRSHP